MWEEFSKLFYLIWGGLAFVTGVIAWTNNKKLSGTSKFTKSLKKLEGTDGIILSKNHQLSYEKSKEGIIVIGPTGTGKTRNVFKPNLLTNYLPKGSRVISDIKGELWDTTHKYRESLGEHCILFEPLGKDKNSCFNPLTNCWDFTEIRQMAQRILSNGSLSIRLESGGGASNDANWLTMAVPLFTAALLFCKDKSINTAAKLIINSNLDMLSTLFKSSNDEDIREQWNIFMSSAGCEAEMAGILSTLTNNIQLFTDHYIIKNTGSNDFKPEDLREKPICLYIKYEASDSNYLAPFLSIFYSQLITHIMKTKGLPVYFMLDELQNLGHVANLAEIVSLSRSYDMVFLLAVQSLSKLYDIYGHNNVTSLLNNIKTKCVLSSISDMDTLNYVSGLCGFTTIIDKIKTKTKLLEDDEIRRLDGDKILLICHNRLPIIDYKYKL